MITAMRFWPWTMHDAHDPKNAMSLVQKMLGADRFNKAKVYPRSSGI